MSCSSVQPSDVRTLISTSLGDPALQGLINDSCDFVTEVLAGKNVAQGTIDRIVKYYAAHLVSMRQEDRRSTEYKAGQKMEKFEGKKDGIGDFAETAISFDPTGCLARRLTDRPVFAFAAGKTREDP